MIVLPVYLVVFDLRSRHESYDAFFSLLEAYDHVKLFDHAWYIAADGEAREVYGKLSQGLKGSDRLMIHAVDRDFAGYIPGKANAWVYSHLEPVTKKADHSRKRRLPKKEASLLQETIFKPKGRL